MAKAWLKRASALSAKSSKRGSSVKQRQISKNKRRRHGVIAESKLQRARKASALSLVAITRHIASRHNKHLLRQIDSIVALPVCRSASSSVNRAERRTQDAWAGLSVFCLGRREGRRRLFSAGACSAWEGRRKNQLCSSLPLPRYLSLCLSGLGLNSSAVFFLLRLCLFISEEALDTHLLRWSPVTWYLCSPSLLVFTRGIFLFSLGETSAVYYAYWPVKRILYIARLNFCYIPCQRTSACRLPYALVPFAI